jgi:hypothetical protein
MMRLVGVLVPLAAVAVVVDDLGSRAGGRGHRRRGGRVVAPGREGDGAKAAERHECGGGGDGRTGEVHAIEPPG